MKTRKLGSSDLNLSVIGLGAWAIGGSGWAYGWGDQSDKNSVEAIKRSLDLGVNWIDTAPVYGLGHSEEIVGKAIKGLRDKFYIATKCGLIWDAKGKLGYDLSAQSVKKEVENSLARLKISYIDLYQIHWPFPDDKIEEAWEEIMRLKDEGKIRYGGVSNFNVPQIQRILKIGPVVSLQPPYNMLNRAIEKDIINFCADSNIGIVAYSPMSCGLLTGKYDGAKISSLPEDDWRKKENGEFREPKLEVNLWLIEELKKVADKLDITVAQLSLAWVINREAVTAAITGTRNKKQIEETAPASGIILSVAIMDRIGKLLKIRDEKLGIIHEPRKSLPRKYKGE